MDYPRPVFDARHPSLANEERIWIVPGRSKPSLIRQESGLVVSVQLFQHTGPLISGQKYFGTFNNNIFVRKYFILIYSIGLTRTEKRILHKYFANVMIFNRRAILVICLLLGRFR